MEFDRQSLSSMSSGRHMFERPGSDIKMTGYLKKLKTMKKKYFVLRCTSSSGPARLEYYDSEKKYKSGQQAKRSILLHTCFNINKRTDPRHGRHGIALYANEECFTVLTESEREQEAWLAMFLEYQNEYLPDGDMHKEHYDHVWQVTLQPRGLGQAKGSKGQYRLCLNQTTVSLVKISSSLPQYMIQLVTIRTVAHHENSFRLEVGNYAPTGAGEFWFTVDDSSIVKDMHETLLQYMNAIVKDPSMRRDQRPVHVRSNRDVNSQSVPYSQNSSMDAHSPSSPNYPHEYPGGGHRLRSDSRTSRTSKTSFHEDTSPGFIQGYNGDHLDVVMREHCSMVPPDMSPPPSPSCLDDQMKAYHDMDKQRSSLTSIASTSTQSSTYLPMGGEPQGLSQRGEISSPYSDESVQEYISMAGQPTMSTSHPIPIHTHSFSEPLHSSHLPTVREGGSNEGYIPMDHNSPASSFGMPRPDPAVCMLSDNSSGLPPRTYSLGSKPVKKISSYIEMGGTKKAAGNDMSRATSAPHILKGRKYREQRTESPTPSASPLSMSLKSDDSDSFIDYIPMRPRTASDSFNYRNRTSSFGKTQQTCRPRSSSHGQGTRPVINFSKLSVEKSRISQEPSQRTSQESSLQGSFDSLRVSNESLRRMSQDMRQMSGSNASDYADMRGTPSPQMKNMKSDGYASMQVGPTGRRSSPHRTRTDSSGSGRHDFKSNSSDRLHQQTYLQQISDYTEITPQNQRTVSNGESYINMDYNQRHSSSSDSKNVASTPLALPSHPEDPRYMNMDMDDKNKKSDGNRSLSMENVDTYVIFDHRNGNKPRTGSLGSKDKSVSKPVSSRKSSSVSVSSASSPSSSGIVYPQNQQPVSASTRTGGSSDSIKKTSRQSSTEKYGSLGKDFRKKSGSTGSRPTTGKPMFGMSLGKDHHVGNSGITSGRGPASSKPHWHDAGDDEYIEFSPTATKGDSHHHQVQSSVFSHSKASHPSVPNPSRSSSSLSSGSCPRSNTTPSPADNDTYTIFSPTVTIAAKSVHFHQQNHQHHHPIQAKSGSSPSSAQVRQIPTEDQDVYIAFDLRSPLSPFPNMPTHPFSNTKQVEAKDAPVYVGFERTMKPVPKALPQPCLGREAYNVDLRPFNPTQLKPITPISDPEYVGFQPGMIPVPKLPAVSPQPAYPGREANNVELRPFTPTPHKPITPISDPEYVGFQPGMISVAKPPAESPQPVSFGKEAYFDLRPCTPTQLNKPITPTSDPEYVGFQPGMISVSKPPAASPQPASFGREANSQLHPCTPTQLNKPVTPTSDPEYVGFQPGMKAIPKAPTTPPPLHPASTGSEADYVQHHQKTSTLPHKPITPTAAISYIVSDNSCSPIESNKPKHNYTSSDNDPSLNEPISSDISQNPLTGPAFDPEPPGKNLSRNPSQISEASNSEVLPVENLQEKPSDSSVEKPPPLSQLYINVGEELKLSPLMVRTINIDSPKEKNEQRLQQQQRKLQQLPQNIMRQLSAPASQSSPGGRPLLESQIQPHSPQPMSPDIFSSSRHKHLSNSSGMDSPSPTGSGSRHKHWSGSSNSSQKSRKSSSDSERSFRKAIKSDASTNPAGGQKTFKFPNEFKLSGSCFSGNSQSHRSTDTFLMDLSSLEAKIIPAEAKIRHSLGDVTSAIGKVNKEGHGLIRPDSTPCIQNLTTIVDQGSRSVGDTPTSTPRSGSIQFSVGPRSRHSLSDLGTYQQMNFTSSGSSSYSSEPNNSSSCKGVGNISGINESLITEQAPKPLNYVKLDLGYSEGQGDADGKSTRVKSRNSSDADEKPPPLKYAEIDFVRSQCRGKTLPMGLSGDASSSKS